MGQGEKGADMAVGIQTIPAAALHTTDQGGGDAGGGRAAGEPEEFPGVAIVIIRTFGVHDRPVYIVPFLEYVKYRP